MILFVSSVMLHFADLTKFCVIIHMHCFIAQNSVSSFVRFINLILKNRATLERVYYIFIFFCWSNRSACLGFWYLIYCNVRLQ